MLCVPISGILGHVIVNWNINKHKKRRFLAWKLINSLIIPKPLDVQIWKFNTKWVLVSKAARSRDPNFTSRKWSKIWRLWTNISRKLRILMKNGLWFSSTLLITFRFAVFVYANLNSIFLVLVSFFWHFFFSRYLLLKTINSLYSKFDRPKISRRTSVQLKLGVPGLGDPLNWILQNLELLYH